MTADGVGTDDYAQRVPNQPKTTKRGVRVDDELWHAALAAAREDKITVSDVIRDALRDYLAGRASTGASKRLKPR